MGTASKKCITEQISKKMDRGEICWSSPVCLYVYLVPIFFGCHGFRLLTEDFVSILLMFCRWIPVDCCHIQRGERFRQSCTDLQMWWLVNSSISDTYGRPLRFRWRTSNSDYSSWRIWHTKRKWNLPTPGATRFRFYHPWTILRSCSFQWCGVAVFVEASRISWKCEHNLSAVTRYEFRLATMLCLRMGWEFFVLVILQ